MGISHLELLSGDVQGGLFILIGFCCTEYCSKLILCLFLKCHKSFLEFTYIIQNVSQEGSGQQVFLWNGLWFVLPNCF